MSNPIECPDCGNFTDRHCNNEACLWRACRRRGACGGYGIPGGRWQPGRGTKGKAA